MRKPKALRLGGAWAEVVNAENDIRIGGRAAGLSLMPWLTAPQCRRLAAWLIKAAEWIEAKDGGR